MRQNPSAFPLAQVDRPLGASHRSQHGTGFVKATKEVRIESQNWPSIMRLWQRFSIARQHRFGIFAAWIGRRDGVED